MNASGLLDKMAAILRRDLLSALRYRNGFLLTAFASVAELASFYFLARAIGPGFRPEGVEYFPFLLVGTGFYTFLVMGVHSFLLIVQDAQQTGTLEVLMTTSTPAPVLIFMSAMSAFAGHMVQFVIYVGGGLLLFRVPLGNPNLPTRESKPAGLCFGLSALGSDCSCTWRLRCGFATGNSKRLCLALVIRIRDVVLDRHSFPRRNIAETFAFCRRAYSGDALTQWNAAGSAARSEFCSIAR